MIKEFRHQFKNGQIITLKFDLSKDMPYCEANLKMDKQSIDMIQEYRQWQNEVVVPEILSHLSPSQVDNFVRFGMMKMKEQSKYEK